MLELKYMKCSSCKRQRLETKSGICVICKPLVEHGTEVKKSINKNNQGTHVLSKTGRARTDNAWMRQLPSK